MAIVSIKNKTKSGSLLVGNAYYFPNSYESIATTTVGSGGTSSITFSSIPQTFTHLQLRFLMVSSSASSSCFTYVNGDTTQANYKEHVLYGNGASASAGSYSNSYMPQFNGGAATTSPGSYILDILDYTNTNKYKTLRGLGGYDGNGSGYLALESMLWMNTAAITSLQFSPNAQTWSQYANISLYGIKAAS